METSLIGKICTVGFPKDEYEIVGIYLQPPTIGDAVYLEQVLGLARP